MGISHSRFSNSGAIVKYQANRDGGVAKPPTEVDRRSINFALVGPGDLSPRGIMIEDSLMQNSLRQTLETFSIAIFYSDDLYDFIRQSRDKRLEWKNKEYSIKDYSDLGSHKVYLKLECINRSH